jgi:methionyl-tRNA synthetase
VKNKYITTPIYYVNDVPHVGHAYSTVIADVIARYWRIKDGKDNVYFLTGTDEHGAKIQKCAEEKGQKPQEFVDKIVPKFESAWKKLQISNDYFIRTTNPNHEKYASDMLKIIYDNGLIYKAVYKGLYCTGCEKFISDDDIIDGVCPVHPNKKLDELSEENWFFKLSSFEKELQAKIESDEIAIHPQSRKNEILGKLKGGLQDISISRAGVAWGIPVPWDNSQSIYVWVDALINYYSALKINDKFEQFWPAYLHLIGKDIVWFHTVIWPALLLASGNQTPQNIFAHGYFTIAGQKMSKSLGNVISPEQLVSKYGVDATRYLLVTACRLGEDGDVSIEKFDIEYNAVLANGIGNLVSRTAKLASSGDFSFVSEQLPDFDTKTYEDHFLRFEPDQAILWVMGELNKLNHYLDENKPWILIKEGKDDEAQLVLRKLVTSIRQLVPLLAPFMPNFSEVVVKHFVNEKILKIDPFFPRIEKKS